METDSQIWKTDLQLPKGKEGEGGLPYTHYYI